MMNAALEAGIIGALRGKGAEKPCPACGALTYSVFEVNGVAPPQVGTRCMACGHQRYFDKSVLFAQPEPKGNPA